jgi:hypothetical protein
MFNKIIYSKMKKLEKLGSKLFEEFRGDEVSELANVVGGIYTMTHEDEGKGCEDTWKGPVFWGRTEKSLDLMRSELATDRGTYGVEGGDDFGDEMFGSQESVSSALSMMGN